MPVTQKKSAKAPRKENPSSALGWLCLLFLVWRFTDLFFLHPRYFFLWPDEELYRGLFGKLLSENAPIPILHLLPDNYGTGGALTVGFLTSLVFRILGPTAFALKLVPLTFSFASLIGWYKLIERYLNPRVAVLSALLMIFAPPRYIAYSLTAMGDHYESVFLSVISLWFFFKIVLERKQGALYLIFMGILAGYSLWFAYIYGLTLLTCLIFWGLRDPRFYFSKKLVPLSFGFLIGFSPWFFINTQSQFQGFSVYGIPLWEYFGPKYLLTGFANFYNFSISAPGLFLDSFLPDMDQKLVRRLIQLVYCAVIFGPLLAAKFRKSAPVSPASFWGRTPALIRWLWIYVFLFLVIIQCSRFRDLYYYFPAVTMSFILAAFYWDRLLSRQTKNKMTARRILLFFIIAVSLTANISKFSFDHRGKIFSTKGYAYFGAGFAADFSAFSFCKDLASCCNNFPLLDQPLTPKELHGLGMGVAITAAENVPEDTLIKAAPPALCPLIFRKYFYYMLGTESFLRVNDLKKALTTLEFFKKKSPRIYTLAVRGAFTEFARNPVDPETLDAQLQSAKAMISAEEMPFFWRSFSEVKTTLWLKQPKESRPKFKKFIGDLLSQYPSSEHRYLLQGSGRAFLRRAYGKRFPANFLKQLEALPPEIKTPMLEGVGMATLSKDLLVSRLTLLSTLQPILSEGSMESVSEGQQLLLRFFDKYPLKETPQVLP